MQLSDERHSTRVWCRCCSWRVVVVERGSERGGVAAERSRSGRCYTGGGALGPESGWLWSAVVMTIVGHSPPLRVRVDWSGVERGGEGKGGDRLWTAKGVSLDRNSDATVLATRLTQLDSRDCSWRWSLTRVTVTTSLSLAEPLNLDLNSAAAWIRALTQNHSQANRTERWPPPNAPPLPPPRTALAPSPSPRRPLQTTLNPKLARPPPSAHSDSERGPCPARESNGAKKP